MITKCFKPLLVFLLSFDLLLGSNISGSSISASAENKDSDCLLKDKVNTKLNEALKNAKESKTIQSNNGNKVIEITDPEILKELSSSLPKNDGQKLVGVAIAYTETDNVPSPSSLQNNSVVTPQWGSGYYLKNINSSVVCGIEILRQSSYKGPATATMSVKTGVAATWSANVGVSAEEVSTGLGFNVTKSYEVSDTYQIQVPTGKTYTIVARPFFQYYTYEVWYDPLIGFDYKAGNGNAYKPIGVCFYYYQ